MKNTIYIIIFCFLIFTSCEAQNKDNNQNKKVSDSIEVFNHTPKIDIKVNKQFDEDGNQIGFDSTYTSYYSNVEGDTMLMDSLFKQFSPFFQSRYPDFFNSQFDNIFFNDSMIYDDFFRADFFKKRFEMHNKHLKRIMNEMDSIKNEFYEKKGEEWNSKKNPTSTEIF